MNNGLAKKCDRSCYLCAIQRENNEFALHNDLKSWHYFPGRVLQPLPLWERAAQKFQQARMGEGRGRDRHPPLLLKRRAALSRKGRGHGAARCSVSRSATARRGRRDAVARTARRCWDMGEASLRAEGEAIQAQRRNLDCFVTLLLAMIAPHSSKVRRGRRDVSVKRIGRRVW